MREPYTLKSWIHDTNTPTYMEVLSVEHSQYYYKSMGDKITSLIIRDTLKVDPSNSVTGHIIFSWDLFSWIYIADYSIFPGSWYFNCER